MSAEQDAMQISREEHGIRRARAKWNGAAITSLSSMHGYIVKKGLRWPHGSKVLEGDLLIPYVSELDGPVMTVQMISEAGEKRFQPDAPTRGLFCVLNDGKRYAEPTGHVWICEGWATGCSIREATGDLVIVAGSIGNLYLTAKKIHDGFCSDVYPEMTWDLAVAADNDSCKGARNAGIMAAVEVYERLGIPFSAPVFDEGEQLTDWNDFAATRGLEETRRMLLERLEVIKEPAGFSS